MVNTEYNSGPQLETGTAKFIAMIRRGLENRYAPLVIAGIAAVIMLPALNAGLIQDDLFHRLRLVEPSQFPEEFSGTGLIRTQAVCRWRCVTCTLLLEHSAI
jgi:hypothetical protein